MYLEKNVAVLGGAINLKGRKNTQYIYLNNSTLYGNKAEEDGGGIYIIYGNNYHFENNKFKSNYAEKRGASIF